MTNKPKHTKLILKNKSSLLGNTLIEAIGASSSSVSTKTENNVVPIVNSKDLTIDKTNGEIKPSKSKEMGKPTTTDFKKDESVVNHNEITQLPTPKKPYLSFTEYNEILEKLTQKYPNVFSKDSPNILAIGIDKEIKANKELGLANKKINYFLSKYCRTKQYRARHIEGAERFNLQGEIIGQISESQANKIKELQDKYLKRKKNLSNLP